MQIQRVYSPTQRQLEKNIFGSCSLAIVADDNTIFAYLNNVTIRKNSKTGEKFLAPPGYFHGEGDQKKHRNYFSIFPLGDVEGLHDTQKKRMRGLVAEVVQIAESGGTPRPNVSGADARPAPVASTSETKPTTTTNEPW